MKTEKKDEHGIYEVIYSEYESISTEKPEEKQNGSLPTVSVVMSVYNGERHLKCSVESILNQTFCDFEFIIINDGSTDSSLSLLLKYLKNDSRIIIINQKNMGLTKSLNRGIREASGKYIGRQDADDVSIINKLEEQVKLLESVQGDVAAGQAYMQIGDSYCIEPKQALLEEINLRKLRFGNIFIHGTLFFKSEVIKKELYDEAFTYSQDYELMIRLIKHEYNLFVIKKPLYYFRDVPGKISVDKVKEQIDFSARACIKHFGNDRKFVLNKKGLRKKILLFIKWLHTLKDIM